MFELFYYQGRNWFSHLLNWNRLAIEVVLLVLRSNRFENISAWPNFAKNYIRFADVYQSDKI